MAASPVELPTHPTARPARRPMDIVCRPFFIGGIAVVLSLGALWGAWLLLRIGTAHAFTGVSVFAINAHGLAQVYGWVGLFVMGFAYQFFPRMWHVELAAPRLARPVLALMVAGLVTATLAMDFADAGPAARLVALAGGIVIGIASTLFAVQLGVTFRRTGRSLEPWTAFIVTGLGWFVLSAWASAAHGWITMAAPTKDALVAAIGTWQAPLRDLQIHGLALFLIIGVSLRTFPALAGGGPVPDRAAWRAFGILVASVVGEVVLFVIYRETGRHAIAALLLLPWIGLIAGTAIIARHLHVFGSYRDPDRTGKFLRASWAWLFVSLAMLLLMPAYQFAAHLPFSHAWYGATRHAITVGFISLMIMGMSARFTAALAGRDRHALGRLWGPFVLVNLGCLLRVTLQVTTDWLPAAYRLIGISGLLEWTGLCWWAFGLLALLRSIRPRVPATARTAP